MKNKPILQPLPVPNRATPNMIVRAMKHDGYGLEGGARYCRQIALNARYNAFAVPGDAEAYQEAAERLEAEAKAEKLALENVEHLEQENQRLTARVLELEKIILDYESKRT